MKTAKIILRYEGRGEVTLDTEIPMPLFSALTARAQRKEAFRITEAHVLSAPVVDQVWPVAIVLPSSIQGMQITGTFS